MLNKSYMRAAANDISEYLNDGYSPSEVIWESTWIQGYSDMASFVGFFLEHFETPEVDQMVGELLEELFKMYAEDRKED